MPLCIYMPVGRSRFHEEQPVRVLLKNTEVLKLAMGVNRDPEGG